MCGRAYDPGYHYVVTFPTTGQIGFQVSPSLVEGCICSVMVRPTRSGRGRAGSSYVWRGLVIVSKPTRDLRVPQKRAEFPKEE
jgi:hypothetical protein